MTTLRHGAACVARRARLLGLRHHIRAGRSDQVKLNDIDARWRGRARRLNQSLVDLAQRIDALEAQLREHARDVEELENSRRRCASSSAICTAIWISASRRIETGARRRWRRRGRR